MNEKMTRAMKEHARGDKPLMIWIPEPLHRAFREMVFKNRTTMRAVTLKFLEYYTGYKHDDGKPNNREKSGT